MDDLWFGVSAIFYAFLDPLFMYVPFINEETKCVMLDNRLKIAAIILRLFGDLRYVVRIIYRIKEGRQKYNYLKRNRIGGTKDDQQYSDFLKKIVMSVANDAVCILPVPQVVILIFLPKMRGLSSLKIMKFLNSLILLQYCHDFIQSSKCVCKLTRICLPCSKKKPKDTLNDKKLPTNIPKWFGIAINIVGYILASHVNAYLKFMMYTYEEEF
ncbi:hypothetical protein M0R45_036628 [Rubus argutus]|uniref:Uncharacterized protein n=1 Tax=Rubus argutus TaxID=59490 RepID=A0AAW1W0H2_RUBAR